MTAPDRPRLRRTPPGERIDARGCVSRSLWTQHGYTDGLYARGCKTGGGFRPPSETDLVRRGAYLEGWSEAEAKLEHDRINPTPWNYDER